MIDYLIKQLNNNDIIFNDSQVDKLVKFHDMLYAYNKNINLTSIEEGNECVDKHFIDSLQLINKLDLHGKRIVDIGTGAGFPGIPLAIFIEDSEFLLVDSLQKRLVFIQKVIEELNIKNIKCLHARAEEIGQNILYREKFDIAVSRAVSSLPVLCEYLLPLVKINGYAIAYKSENVDEEVKKANNAIKSLGASDYKIIDVDIKGTFYSRKLVIISKSKHTPLKYPRKYSNILKKPL